MPGGSGGVLFLRKNLREPSGGADRIQLIPRCVHPAACHELLCRILPDSQHMLHEQAHGSDADPAAKAQGERFAAGFDELYDVSI